MAEAPAQLDYASGDEPQAIAAPSSGMSVGHVTARGFVWGMGVSVTCKLVNMVGQIVLAWLLIPSDFGLIGVAYTVVAVASVLQQGGLCEILVQRQREFNRWANAVFWLSLVAALAAGAAIAGAAPLAARAYHKPITGLLLVLAMVPPVGSMTIVPWARMQIGMRFRTVAVINFAEITTLMLSTVLLACAKMGAYSFAWASLISISLRTTICWMVAPSAVSWNPQVRLWPKLLMDGSTLVVASIANKAVDFGDYMMLGVFRSTEIVGTYYFSFNLAAQALQVLTANIVGVLYPALSSFQADPGHQTRSYLRASKLLVSVGIPLCIFQAVMADPGIHMVFAAKWYPAIPVIQVLSVAMIGRLGGDTTRGLMVAQSRYRTVAGLTVVYGAGFLLCAGTAAFKGGALTVALAVAGWYLVFNPVRVYVAIRFGGGSWRDVAGLYLPPTLLGILAVAPAAGLVRLIPAATRLGMGMRVAVIFVSSVGLYAVLTRLFRREIWLELTSLTRILRRKRSGAPVSAA